MIDKQVAKVIAEARKTIKELSAENENPGYYKENLRGMVKGGEMWDQLTATQKKTVEAFIDEVEHSSPQGQGLKHEVEGMKQKQKPKQKPT